MLGDAAAPLPIRCECGRTITGGRQGVWVNGLAYCLPCLAARPDTPFGVRLRSLRLHWWLTQPELAKRSGVSLMVIQAHESSGSDRVRAR